MSHFVELISFSACGSFEVHIRNQAKARIKVLIPDEHRVFPTDAALAMRYRELFVPVFEYLKPRPNESLCMTYEVAMQTYDYLKEAN